MNESFIARENMVHWEWLVYLEMYVAGIAAGSYLLAAILELIGRGRSPVARVSHLITFPLVAMAGILLIVDLSRPERFWHMVVQSKSYLPMFKWWSPMSLGSWGVLILPAFAFFSFIDALIDRGAFGLGGWRHGHTLHGSTLGKLWAIGGGLAAFLVASYSGILMSVTNLPGWANSAFIGPLYVATAVVTGLGAMLLFQSGRSARGHADVQGLLGASVWLILWQMLLLLVWIATLGAGLPVYFKYVDIIAAVVGAVVLGGIVPLLLLLTRPRGSRASMAGVVAVSILIGGFLVRYAVVMGPQHNV